MQEVKGKEKSSEMQACAPSLDKLRRPRILTALDLQGAVRIYSCECLLIKFPKSRPEHTDSGSKDSFSTIKTESRALPASDVSDGAKLPSYSPPGRGVSLSSAFSKAQ